MLTSSIILCSVLLVIAAAHMLVAFVFRVRTIRGIQRAKEVNGFQPSAAVVLTIRGCDPTLERTIRALIQQNYSDYQIHLVIDNRTDAAWNLVNGVVSEFDIDNRCVVHEMHRPRTSCGLKCSSLVQAVESLDDSIEIVCLIDADVCPHTNWLAELVAPLEDERIGVVTGNHWFAPNDEAPGSLLRSLWNAGAIVPTSFFANPWAGTCAIRKSDIEAADLVDVWKQSIVDDGPIRDAIAPLNKKILFLPSLIMVNREKCTFGYLVGYIARMLTWSRMYERTFILTVLHLCLCLGVLLAAVSTTVFALVTGNLLAAAIVVTGLIGQWAFMTGGYFLVRSGVSRSTHRRGVRLPSVSARRVIRLALFLPVACGIYAWATFKAVTAKRVQWREITYRIDGKSSVEMLRYQPLASPSRETATSEVSI